MANIESPRLQKLQAELEAGDFEALDTFWKSIEAEGTPIFEPVEGNSEYFWVTFLYKGDKNTQNVLFRSLLVDWENLSAGLLTRVPYTHLWYLTRKVRGDILTTYSIVPNDSLLPLSALKTEKEQMERYFEMSKTDPLNSETFLFPKDDNDPDGWPEFSLSILRGPKAAPQPHVEKRADIPHGEVKESKFKSEILGNERRVWVYTPPGYEQKGHKPYHFLFTFDGGSYMTVVPTPTVLDNLLAEGKIPPMVCVMVDNAKDARANDLPPNENFPRFVREELMPWVHEHYNITDDPAKSFIAGSSYGGIASTWNALKNPDIFGNVLSQSGSYWWHPAVRDPKDDNEPGWLIRQFVEAERLPLNFYLDIGLLENKGISSLGEGMSHHSMNRHMRDVLRAKGYPLTYVEYNGGHDYLWWRQTLADGLIALLSTTDQVKRKKK